jgi:hypothetical protein
VSLVVRYLLEVASSIEEVREILGRVPVAMAYNLTIVDAARKVMTAFVAPGRAAEFSASPIATNHRGEIPDSIEHAERYASVERRDCLAELIATDPSPECLRATPRIPIRGHRCPAVCSPARRCPNPPARNPPTTTACCWPSAPRTTTT